MATVMTGLGLYDNMTSVVRNITNSLNLTVAAMDDVHKSVDRSFDSRSIDNARNAIQQTEASLRNLTPPISNAEREQERFNRSLRDGEKGAGNLTRRVTSLVGAYIGIRSTGRMLASGFGIYKGFEQEMSRVQGLSGATAEEFDRLNARAKQLGETTPFTARQAAEGMSFLAMAGFDTNEVIAAMPGLLNTAGAGQMELGQTADIVSNILQGFNINARETGRVADVLTEAFTSSNTDLAMLGETMKYVAPNAYAAGISLEETAAAAGLLGNAGIQGSMAGTALRNVISRMAAPTGEAAKLIDQLGINTVNADGSLKSLSEIVRQVTDATENMGDVQTMAAVKTLVGERAAASFLTLMEAGPETLDEFTSELMNSAGAAEEIMETMLDNTEGKLMLFRSKVEAAWIDFYERLGGGETAEAFDAVLDGLLAALDAILPVLEKIITAAGAVVNFFTENWASISPIIWGIVTAMGAYLIVTKGLTAAIAIKNAVMAANPYVAIAAAIIALITIFIRLWRTNDKFYAGFMRVWHAILNYFDQVPIAFMRVGFGIRNVFQDIRVKTLEIMEKMINGIIDNINKLIGMLNKIPGVSIETLDHVDISSQAAIEAEAKRQAGEEKINEMLENAAKKAEEREQKLLDKLDSRAAKRAREDAEQELDLDDFAAPAAAAMDIDHIGMVDEVGRINDSVDISSEDLKTMRELAEMRSIQNFVTLQPSVNIETGDIREEADFDTLITRIEEYIEGEMVAAAEGVYF